MTKTNKSYKKRLRVTKKGKVLRRGIGGNHYNAKESRSKQLNRKKGSKVSMTNRNKRRFLAGV